MNLKRVEKLLREYARLRPPVGLLSRETAARMRAELAPAKSGGGEVESSPANGEPDSAGRAVGQTHRRQVMIWLVSAAAAASLLVALLVVGRDDAARLPGLVVDGAYDEAGVFRTTRAGPASTASRRDLFYVGVKVDRPAYVRILILDDHGRIELLELSRSGAEERRLAADNPRVFGGYELTDTDTGGVTASIEAFIVVASMTPFDSGLPGWIEKKNQAATRPSELHPEFLARELRERFHCATSVVEP